jgi:hypothetical protein
MKKSNFAEEQIAYALRQVESGTLGKNLTIAGEPHHVQSRRGYNRACSSAWRESASQASAVIC